jgi:hypothetical protein
VPDSPKKRADGSKVYGPYKGSAKNGGRKIYVIRKADGSTTSTDKARMDYEKSTGKKLSKTTHVDHKDNNKNIIKEAWCYQPIGDPIHYHE